MAYQTVTPSRSNNQVEYNATQSSASQLSVEKLSWHIGDKVILDHISFSVAPGEFIGLIGPNGAGKSSLLRCLYRYIKPSIGSVKFNDCDIWHYQANEYAKCVAVVLQETPSHFNLMLDEVVALGLLPHQPLFGATLKRDKELIEQALVQVGLHEKKAQTFNSLSGGEKQRALIARAMVQSPSLLIMDEPTSHLDVKYQIQIMELAKSLGITVIASFHDLNLASAVCDQLLVLDQGCLVANDSPVNVLTTDMISNVFGVCTEVSQHPQHGHPHITYFYGYQHSHKKACHE